MLVVCNTITILVKYYSTPHWAFLVLSFVKQPWKLKNELGSQSTVLMQLQLHYKELAPGFVQKISIKSCTKIPNVWVELLFNYLPIYTV